MKVRQLVQCFVFLKSFNVLSFYAKGNYAIRVKLTIEDQESGECTLAFPTLIEDRQAARDTSKKAIVNTAKSYFQTELFFVTFAQQKVVFNSACIFKVQYAAGKTYKTYLDFQIIYCANRRKTKTSDSEVVSVTRVVDKRRLYINNYNSLNKFKRILFDDSDYFSYTDAFIINQSFGQKVRLHNYQLGQFYSSEILTRVDYQQQTDEQSNLLKSNERNKKLKEIFKFDIEEFYVKMIHEKVMKYRKLYQIYQKFRFYISSIGHAAITNSPEITHLQWIKTDQYKREAALMDHYQSSNPAEVYMLIYQQSHAIIKNTMFVWQKLTEMLITINYSLMEQLAELQIEQERKTKTKWLLTYSEISQRKAEEWRAQFQGKREEIIKMMDTYEEHEIHYPLLIIQNFQTNDGFTLQNREVDSLVVMVHGYQGSNLDMEKARNFMNFYNPFCHGLIIKTIENDIDNPIEKLGQLVADQVKLHLQNTLNNYKRINFIGYSLGGIIARQSLKHLEDLKGIMNVFISFASPHAGICDTSNPLVKTGIWFLTNFQKNKNMKQLNCEPNQDTDIIALCKLSDDDCISWFKRFVAVSSKDDEFVPYDSSRLEEVALRDMTRFICNNLKQKIRRLQRVDVWFDTNHLPGTFDKIIGRRAHIQFLQNRLFLDLFFSNYATLL